MNDGLPASLAEVLEASARTLQARIHTGIPAKVVKYDPVTNTIDAEIVVKNAVWTRAGEREYEIQPIIPSLQVMWPRAGGMICRLPLTVGDFVWLAFSEAALGEWRTTGQLSEPRDSRRHSLGYAYAIPGAHPDTETLSALDAAASVLGQAIFGEDGGKQVRVGPSGVELAPAGVTPINPVALAPAIILALQAIAAWINLASPRIVAMPVPLTGPEQTALTAAAGAVAAAANPGSTALMQSTLVRAT